MVVNSVIGQCFPLVAAYRRRSNGGQSKIKVRLFPNKMRDFRGNELPFRAPERRRIRQPNQDDVGRAFFAAELCQMIDGMKGLHKLMFGRKVGADKNVNVRFDLGHNEKTLPDSRLRCQAELFPVESVAVRAEPRCRQALSTPAP